MTANERLRELLDERGVEYTANERDTHWWPKDNPAGVLAENSRYPRGMLDVYGLTPEQAIAATLGESPCLPHFWTHDGTLHVELPKLPGSISVRLPDQRDREVGSARVWQYTRERIVRCRDCKHGHITVDGKSCKWCDLIATHDIDGNEPNNGYDPEPYFDADFFCAWGKRKEVDE